MQPSPRTRSQKRTSRASGVPGLLVATAAALLVVLAPTGATGQASAAAATRDVEVRPAQGVDPRLQIHPAARLVRDVRGPTPWPVVVTNGSDQPVDLVLAAHLAVPGDDGQPTPGAVASWAVLPRGDLHLGPSEAAAFEVLVTPPQGVLPVALVLTATTPGDDRRVVQAIAVLWDPGHAADVQVEVTVDPGTARRHVRVRDLAAPSVVDVRTVASAWPLPSRSTDAGPLVLLAGTTRELAVDAPTTILGRRTQVVVAVDGTEVARTVAGRAVEPARAAVVALALAALVASAVLWRRSRLA